ncbi:hypothetical protein [Gelidibacter japonicus]|uniref:nSTAND3 domain-containing NTPase n=1 Tax=Gelidibacter japonicus TaxID=1962232 RepID=UPI002AFFFD65|nr:hypothetical protein [Gelidibacter japonicus]
MNQLSSIKERLKNLNDTEFQELCDCYLSLRNIGYKAYSRTGAHEIKQKTTRGTPDSFIQMPNGLYLFVESTTTEHKGKRLLNKLKGDVSDCLDVSKTKIPVNKIQEIILCYNSNLKAVEIEEVNQRALEVMGTLPMHCSLDRLATEIFFHHKNLAHDYLRLPLDTGQIVSLDKFVEQYDNGKQKLATPLAGIFFHRNKELEDVIVKLSTNDIVIISGPAGVGKSKLALESIDRFIESHLDYNGFAVSPKGADLIGDLSAYFEGEENSILLVDDVNRVDKFEQILGFYRGLNHGKLKLVLTVRDYALENVRERLSTYENSIVEIGGFSYEEIKIIIEQEPFGVRNGTYQYKINAIAKGNARLAVMMAMIARKTNKLESLNNVADLFEQYFETFVSDEDAFKDKRVLKALGILSFFYTLPYSNSELLDMLANSFSIASDELREAFDRLHSLDLIELNYQHVRIGEQNLSTYFFYKVFIKDRLLSFESLWNNYFEQHEHRFKDTIYPMHQNFGKEPITEEIKPVLRSYWSTIQSDEVKAFSFLNFAWEFLPDECLAYVEARVDACVPSEVSELIAKYEVNDFSSINNQERHLHLLANFLKEPNFYLDALELSSRFTEQHQQHLPQLIYHIDQNFSFIDDDFINHFKRQANLVDYLIEEVEKGRLQTLVFLAVSRTLLKWLHWTYNNKKESKEEIPNITSVKQIREKILDALCKLYSNYPEEVFTVMIDLSVGYEKHSKYTLEFDLIYLIPWIDKNMKSTNFRHCYYVQEMVRSSIKGKCNHHDFKRMKLTYTHPIYTLFELVNWDRRRAKEDYDFEDYKEFNELKTTDIAKKLIFKSKDEVSQFITQYREILEWKQIRLQSQYKVLEVIIKANLSADLEIGFASFVKFAKLEDEGHFDSQVCISLEGKECLAAHSELAERFWEAIDSEGLNEIWKLEILMSIPIESITKQQLSRLYIVLNEIKRNFRIHLQRLQKYEKVEPNILYEVLQIVVNKIEVDNLKIYLLEEFIIKVSDLTEDVEILKKAYIQQDELDHHFDYTGECLLVILKRDNSFLLELIKEVFGRVRQERVKEHKEFSIVWKLPNIEEVLDEVIEYVVKCEDHYYLSKHFTNAFFQQLTYNVERADKYLLRLVENYSDQPEIIHVVFDVIHNTRKSLFEEAFGIYIQMNQEVECFKKIRWTNNQVAYSANEISGTIRAAKWAKLLELVENVKLGAKTRAIRNYIKGRRDIDLLYAEQEKRRKFFRNSLSF